MKASGWTYVILYFSCKYKNNFVDFLVSGEIEQIKYKAISNLVIL